MSTNPAEPAPKRPMAEQESSKSSGTSAEATKTSNFGGASVNLSTPSRILTVQHHRGSLKKITTMMDSVSGTRVGFTSVLPQSSKTSRKSRTSLPESLAVTPITLQDMNPTLDHVYKNRMINLAIVEDPFLGLFTAIHVVVRDDNGSCINACFYHLEHTCPMVQKRLSFGSRIQIVDPYYRIANDSTLNLRVDDPQNVIYISSGEDKRLCRYCLAEDPPLRCGKCKRALYCNKYCQTQDWKVLKHKNICQLPYFEKVNLL